MTIDNPMPQIDTIVMLMLENRSLDTMLGWLYNGGRAKASCPEGSSLAFDGIPDGVTNCYHDTAVAPLQGARDLRVPHWNPNEVFDHAAVQMYGGKHGLSQGWSWADTPHMAGFAYDFHSLGDRKHLSDVMGAYTADQLPVLYGLAQKYAVSDRWFSSIPSETNPNRAFSICGTSLGAKDNGDPNASDPKGKVFDAPTLFNVISGRRSWGIYWQYRGLGSMDPGHTCYTRDLFPRIGEATGGEIETYDTFLSKLDAGKLPELCYLEPYWGGGAELAFLQGSDYHPPMWVGPCEAALGDLFARIVNSPQWPHMLFIVTFDEHGGTWDHVPPPPTVPPDDHRPRKGFQFDRMGVRVPTILISPFVEEGTVFRATADASADFDHTSFLATICKWAGVAPDAAGLGRRVAQAPTFEGVVGTVARTDRPDFPVPDGYADQGGGLGHFNILGIHGGPVDLADVDIETFRRVAKESRDSEDFVRRLQALTPATKTGRAPTP